MAKISATATNSGAKCAKLNRWNSGTVFCPKKWRTNSCIFFISLSLFFCIIAQQGIYKQERIAPILKSGQLYYTYMGNFSQIALTVAFTSAAVPSKSLAVSAMQCAICFISSAPKPRVVTAAVPMRTPLVTEGF